jgi:hypothetical protein
MQMQMQMQNQQNQMMQMMMMMMQGQMKTPHADTPQWNGHDPSFLTARSSARSSNSSVPNLNDLTNDDDDF